MNTTTMRPVEDGWRAHPLPALAPIDRLALHVGLQLLLWTGRRGERADRAEQARVSRAADRAAAARRTTFVARTHAGPTW